MVVQSGEGTKFSVGKPVVICPAGAQPTGANAEVALVTAISTDTLTITRAQEGSSARTVLVGDQIFDAVTAKQLSDLARSSAPAGRLTLTSGTPVTTADVTGAGTIYFAPIYGNTIALYDGTFWELCTFAELSLALTVTAAKNYDVFLYNNVGTLTLELSAAWTNDTTRADALALQDGIQVKSSDHTRRLIGTIRADGTNTTADSGGGVTTSVGGTRFVWNMHNRRKRTMIVIDTTDTWSYTTNTWRQARATAGNKVEYVVGLSEDAVEARAIAVANVVSNSGAAAKVGVGVDSTTAPSGLRQGGYNPSASNFYVALLGLYEGFPGIGYHALNWLEKGADVTSTFIGDNGADGQQTGLDAYVWA